MTETGAWELGPDALPRMRELGLEGLSPFLQVFHGALLATPSSAQIDQRVQLALSVLPERAVRTLGDAAALLVLIAQERLALIEERAEGRPI